jgi:hypothetical protein
MTDRRLVGDHDATTRTRDRFAAGTPVEGVPVAARQLRFLGRRSGFLAALVLTGMLVATALAATAKPVKGGRYSGAVKSVSGEAVTFTVSSDGKSVRDVRITPYIPNRCGAGGPPPQESSKPASISAQGKFTTKVTQKASTATVTGTFLKNRAEQGTIKTKLTGSPTCNATFKYATKAR